VIARPQDIDRPRTYLLDPPWPESGGGRVKRGADRHYPLVKVRDMPGVIHTATWTDGSRVLQVAGPAHMYLWVTNNYLPDGLNLLVDLGFRYVTNVVWIKTKDGRRIQAGLGQYFRGGHELMLFGVRGDGYATRTDRKDLSTVIMAPRTDHSAKPLEAHRLIEARSFGPYVEMFARAPREGWRSWGPHALGAE